MKTQTIFVKIAVTVMDSVIAPLQDSVKVKHGLLALERIKEAVIARITHEGSSAVITVTMEVIFSLCGSLMTAEFIRRTAKLA
jgi:hypothetical protein